GEVGGCVAIEARVASATRVALGVGVRMTMVGVARVVGCAVASTFALGDGFRLGVGFALGDVDALADAEAFGEAARDGVGDGVAANVAVLSGSGVKLGRAVGACTVPPAPKTLVSKPPSSRPPRITSTISGIIGIPPRLGGSGSSRRRRG
ncbi:MAG: hypothetical protein WB491_11655, partial [Candidatus Aquilonibacter sp.]